MILYVSAGLSSCAVYKRRRQEMKTKFGIKEVVAIGIGTALFVVLTNVQVPFGIIPNTAL